MPLHQARERTRREFEERFLHKTFDSYQGWKVDDLEEIKSFFSTAESNILLAVKEWAKDNSYEAHVENHPDHEVVALQQLEEWIDEGLDPIISLCHSCNCMTKTINNKCGKCKELKQ